MNKFYVHEKYMKKTNTRCFIGGAIIGFGLALINPIVRLVHYAVDETIRGDIRRNLFAEEEEE